MSLAIVKVTSTFGDAPLAWITQLLIRGLQKIRRRTGDSQASHLALGEQGEAEAFFYLQRLGYRMVANNFRVPQDRGEIDLIGWDGDTLCFIEVKTRTDVSFAPPSTAVTRGKQRNITSVARRYLRRLSVQPPCRFDILSIVSSLESGPLEFTLRKGAFGWDTEKSRMRKPRYFDSRPRFRT
jgi:putative endonuclease